ncbi:MAG TPA: DUF1844 domain-containing protein [Verrucomicrobiae bacterium]|jgi:hypothetical protein|nr:DUF1844 domain-containing protein [Verrucomicrobiae bacterium]
MAKKEEEFVVSDRRRFAPEGDLRPNMVPAEEEKVAPPAAPQAAVAAPQPAGTSPEADSEEMPEPPSEAEQQTQRDEYHASGRKIDEMINQAGGPGAGAEVSFDRLIESFYMTALMQMGAVRQEGEQPRVDIIGARQTIDSISLLQEKTKGNLTDKEQTLLQNVLFELRMAWIEITNAIAKAPAHPPGNQPAGIKK